jgi:hypothetical protein
MIGNLAVSQLHLNDRFKKRDEFIAPHGGTVLWRAFPVWVLRAAYSTTCRGSYLNQIVPAAPTMTANKPILSSEQYRVSGEPNYVG